MVDRSPTWSHALLVTAFAAVIVAPGAASLVPTPYVAEAEDKLVPEAVDARDEFGRALAMDGDHLVLGNLMAGTGEAYVYERTSEGPRLEAVLSGDAIDDKFGAALALDGDELLVGAPATDVGEHTSAGAVHLYQETEDGGWERQRSFTASEPARLNGFGRALALDGDHLVIGEPDEKPPEGHPSEGWGSYDSNGAIHVYEPSAEGYEHAAKIRPPGDVDRERLGVSLAIHEGKILAGAPGDAHRAEDPIITQGSVFVYAQQGEAWHHVETLTPREDHEANLFGSAIDVDGDTLAVGAPGPRSQTCCDPLQMSGSGQAYAYKLDPSGAEAEQRLLPALQTAGSAHGTDVAVDQGRIFVSAPDAPANCKLGTVSVFEQTAGWVQTGQILAEDGEATDQLGTAIAADDGMLAASAPWQDAGGPRSGAVYTVQASSDPNPAAFATLAGCSGKAAGLVPG